MPYKFEPSSVDLVRALLQLTCVVFFYRLGSVCGLVCLSQFNRQLSAFAMR